MKYRVANGTESKGLKHILANEGDCGKKFNARLSAVFIASSRSGVEYTRLEAKAKDKDTKKIRSQGRGQTLSRPRTGMLEAKDQGHKRKCSPKEMKKVFTKIFQAISKTKKKRSLQKFFKRSLRKNVFQKIFQALHKILTIQKIVQSSSRGQANFRGLEASRPRTSKCVLEDVLEAKDVLEDSTSGLKYVVLFSSSCSRLELYLSKARVRVWVRFRIGIRARNG